jgi:hypothetical protein
VIGCPPCSLRIALEEAPDRAAINVLWQAHGPDGDQLWGEEHQAAGVARYIALPATEEWPDLDIGDEPPAEPEPADERPLHVQADELQDQVEGAEQWQPYAVVEAIDGWPEIILWCHECLLPPGHPQASDPVSWCDCDHNEPSGCAPEWSCRRRAHDPIEHDTVPDDEPPAEPAQRFAAEDDEAARRAAEGDAVEPGPFAHTMDLADLRDALREADTTQRVDELYDQYGPEAGGPWDDECQALGQAVYDREGPQEEAQS